MTLGVTIVTCVSGITCVGGPAFPGSDMQPATRQAEAIMKEQKKNAYSSLFDMIISQELCYLIGFSTCDLLYLLKGEKEKLILAVHGF
jgi:hypothetical protein